MVKKGEGERKCDCREPFVNGRGEQDTCHCTMIVSDPAQTRCWFCRGASPFGDRTPSHTPSYYQAQLRKLGTAGWGKRPTERKT